MSKAIITTADTSMFSNDDVVAIFKCAVNYSSLSSQLSDNMSNLSTANLKDLPKVSKQIVDDLIALGLCWLEDVSEARGCGRGANNRIVWFTDEAWELYFGWKDSKKVQVESPRDLGTELSKTECDIANIEAEMAELQAKLVELEAQLKERTIARRAVAIEISKKYAQEIF